MKFAGVGGRRRRRSPRAGSGWVAPGAHNNPPKPQSTQPRAPGARGKLPGGRHKTMWRGPRLSLEWGRAGRTSSLIKARAAASKTKSSREASSFTNANPFFKILHPLGAGPADVVGATCINHRRRLPWKPTTRSSNHVGVQTTACPGPEAARAGRALLPVLVLEHKQQTKTLNNRMTRVR